ncbi:MAG: YhgN family NAAT transporter [Wenzhouxiangellaceae bacterium]|nr:YhgN family NAAT transporter [Wenzhouxiangellaceae bacterium]MBS3747511.1 YhgN family NAAT transporter [Wenzhouxiangellaceae bacterium]MBS3824478.1 YhgN family NAAT transporter [Wenzhouxiangellaceae bacterium]
MDLIGAFVLLFVVMDPLGNIPIFVSVLDHVRPERRYKVLARELLIALAILFAFLFGGQYLLAALHLSQYSVSVAGGIILFLIALKMIFPVPRQMRDDDEPDDDEEPFLVPLAVPMVAGPSAMAILLLLATRHPDRLGLWSLALFLAWAATAIILAAAPLIKHMLGKRGLIAVERLMGMLLVAISVQMFLEGITEFLGDYA